MTIAERVRCKVLSGTRVSSERGSKLCARWPHSCRFEREQQGNGESDRDERDDTSSSTGVLG
jgi:hypothetical protein